jgi:hypothetical protein
MIWVLLITFTTSGLHSGVTISQFKTKNACLAVTKALELQADEVEFKVKCIEINDTLTIGEKK